MKLAQVDPRHISENSTIDEVGGHSKISGIESQVDYWAKLFKFKNRIRPSLVKFQLLAKLSSKPNFLTPGARSAYAKLRQAFIETSIFYYFDPQCHIQIKTDTLGYTIGWFLSQLTLNNLDR